MLSDVPDMLAYATDKYAVHSNDKTLSTRVHDYCTVVIDSTTELTHILLRTHKGNGKP